MPRPEATPRFARSGLGEGRGSQSRFPGHRFQHIDQPRITQMIQTVGDRIDSRQCRRLIHNRLVREGVLEPRWRSQWPGEEHGPGGVREHPLTLDRPGAAAMAAHATDNVRGGSVAAVLVRAGILCLRRLVDGHGLEAGEKTGDDVAGSSRSWPATRTWETTLRSPRRRSFLPSRAPDADR